MSELSSVGEVGGIEVMHGDGFVWLHSQSLQGGFRLPVALNAPMGDEACQLRDLINSARNSEAAAMRARRDASSRVRPTGEGA